MTKREAIELTQQENRLMALGISRTDAEALRRISMTLRRWFEHECNGDIQRDETTDKPYAVVTHYYKGGMERRYPVADRETGARKRLATIMARYPNLTAYVQGDPRGCSLYILSAEDVASAKRNGHSIDAIYNRGVAVA